MFRAFKPGTLTQIPEEYLLEYVVCVVLGPKLRIGQPVDGIGVLAHKRFCIVQG